MNKFLLYLGIILIFSGIGTGVGIFLVIFYFWDDIKKSISNNSMVDKNNLSEKKSNPNYYNNDTAEEMK